MTPKVLRRFAVFVWDLGPLWCGCYKSVQHGEGRDIHAPGKFNALRKADPMA
jgi:hypothetical protein